MVVRGKEVAVAWYTEAARKPLVRFALSADGGKTFGPSVVVDDADPLGRVDVARLDDGRHAVSWLGRLDAKRAEVRVRVVGAKGPEGDAHAIAEVTAERTSGFPRLASLGDSLLVAWTDPVPGGYRVRTARLTEP